jgi:hypothetical protein
MSKQQRAEVNTLLMSARLTRKARRGYPGYELRTRTVRNFL